MNNNIDELTLQLTRYYYFAWMEAQQSDMYMHRKQYEIFSVVRLFLYNRSIFFKNITLSRCPISFFLLKNRVIHYWSWCVIQIWLSRGRTLQSIYETLKKHIGHDWHVRPHMSPFLSPKVEASNLFDTDLFAGTVIWEPFPLGRDKLDGTHKPIELCMMPKFFFW